VRGAGAGVDPASAQLAVGSPDAGTYALEHARIRGCFDGFIGNKGVVDQLVHDLAIRTVERRPALSPLAFFGEKSTGKTELAKRVSRALDQRLLEFSNLNLPNAQRLDEAIRRTASEMGVRRLQVVRDDQQREVDMPPPMTVFIDEAHLLSRTVQESLLTATEPKDRVLHANAVGAGRPLSTAPITFIIATTHPGKLAEALKSRFAKHNLESYDLAQVVLILRAHLRGADFDAWRPKLALLDDAALECIARSSKLVPRQARENLRAIGEQLTYVGLPATLDAVRSWFAEVKRIDVTGLDDRDRAYLGELYPAHVRGLEALASALGTDPANLEDDVESYLLRLRLIDRGPQGRRLTDAGRRFVDAQRRARRGGG
jgi:Holliday junction DNA helicase RuvB